MDTQDRIEVLNGLRGLAVLLVLLSHLGGLFSLPTGVGIGKAGVFLFFTLSAYLLTNQALVAVRQGRTTPGFWASYLVRRVMRIYPLYTLVLLISAAGYAIVGKYFIALTPDDVISHLLLLEGKSIPLDDSCRVYLLPGVAICFCSAGLDACIWSMAGTATGVGTDCCLHFPLARV